MTSQLAETTSARWRLLFALESIANANGISLTDGVVVPENVLYTDYQHPNHGSKLFTANLVLAALTALVVLARFWTRAFVAGGVGSDDVTIGAAMVVVIGSAALNCFGVRQAGVGKHFYDLTVEQVTKLLKVSVY
jgi:hypothetical protein